MNEYRSHDFYMVKVNLHLVQCKIFHYIFQCFDVRVTIATLMETKPPIPVIKVSKNLVYFSSFMQLTEAYEVVQSPLDTAE